MTNTLLLFFFCRLRIISSWLDLKRKVQRFLPDTDNRRKIKGIENNDKDSLQTITVTLNFG